MHIFLHLPLTVIGYLFNCCHLKYVLGSVQGIGNTTAVQPSLHSRSSGEWRYGERPFHVLCAMRELFMSLKVSLAGHSDKAASKGREHPSP